MITLKLMLHFGRRKKAEEKREFYEWYDSHRGMVNYDLPYFLASETCLIMLGRSRKEVIKWKQKQENCYI